MSDYGVLIVWWSWLVFTHGQLCYSCNACVVVLGVLHVYKYRCITRVVHTCVLHMFYTCNACVGYIHLLHMYFYTCNTCVWYTPVLHVWNMSIIVVWIEYVIHLKTPHMYYMCDTHVLHVYHTCNIHVAHLVVYTSSTYLSFEQTTFPGEISCIKVWLYIKILVVWFYWQLDKCVSCSDETVLRGIE